MAAFSQINQQHTADPCVPNALNESKPKATAVTVVTLVLLVATGFALRLFINQEAIGPSILKECGILLLGLAAFCAGYSLDLSLIFRFSFSILAVFVAGQTALTFLGNSSPYLLILSPVVFVGLIHKVKYHSHSGLGLCLLVLAFSCMAFAVSEYLNAAVAQLSLGTILLLASIYSGCFRIKKVPATLAVLFVGFAIFLACWFMCSPLPQNDDMARKLLSVLAGGEMGNIVQYLGTNMAFAFLINQLGWPIFFLIAFECLCFFASCALYLHEVDNPSSRLLAVGIMAMLAVQSCFYLFANFGFGPTASLPFPFLTRGGIALILYLFAAGLLLSGSRTCTPRSPVHKHINQHPKGIKP